MLLGCTSFLFGQSRREFCSEMVVETRPMSSSCLSTPSNPDYRAYKPPNKTPVSGKTGLSLTKISPSFRSLVLLNLSRCKSRYTVSGTCAWTVPLCLKYSNQIKACKCTGVSLKRITRISFSRFIRRKLFSSPSQLAFPYHTSKQMHMFCTYTGTPSETIFRTYVCSLLILSRSTKLQYQSCLPASTSQESASASLHRLWFRSFCRNKETLSWRRQISARCRLRGQKAQVTRRRKLPGGD